MRGCPKCGMLINHDDRCKHMICYSSTTMRHQSITAMQILKTLSGHERCQEGVEGGSHDVSGPWIEVTIIPVVRLEIVHLKKSLWRDKMLVCGGESSPWKDRILLCGGADTAGTEPDHALWWKRDVSLQWRAQDVRVVHKALPMGINRASAWSQLTEAYA